MVARRFNEIAAGNFAAAFLNHGVEHKRKQEMFQRMIVVAIVTIEATFIFGRKAS